MHAAVDGHAHWQGIVSSPLVRCRDFARKLGEKQQLPVTLDERFQEIGFGEWEGRTPEELLREDPDNLHRFWQDPAAHRPPGAESLASFRDRVLSAWNELLVKHAGEHVLLVCHAGVIRIIISHVLEMPLNRLFRLVVPTAGVTRIRIDYGDPPLPRLIFHAGRL
jgi:alpha-ribazole phosphatase/probable phosphoglycerate mutase